MTSKEKKQLVKFLTTSERAIAKSSSPEEKTRIEENVSNVILAARLTLDEMLKIDAVVQQNLSKKTI